MNTLLKFLMIFILVFAPSLAGDNLVSEYRIIVPGSFFARTQTESGSQQWYGLFKTDSGQVLKKVDASVKIEAVQGHDNQQTTVFVDHPLVPLFLFQAPKDFTLGPVKTFYFGHDIIEPWERVVLDNVRYLLIGMGNITDEGYRHPGDLLVTKYQVKLFKNQSPESAQVLAVSERAAFESFFELIWAGDLDGDDELDLFMDLSWGDVGRHYALFLSSEAVEKELIKLVAELYILGC